eukprot:jgi/Hompol1/4452/HPOL_000214-RA
MAIDSPKTLPVSAAAPGFCVECEDQPSVVECVQCRDVFCQVCFSHQHRKGSRRTHTVRRILNADALDSNPLSKMKKQQQQQKSGVETDATTKEVEVAEESVEEFLRRSASLAASSTNLSGSNSASSSWFIERSKHIPLRLTLDERKMLRLLDAALNVSEYTDKIDVLIYSNRTKRVVNQIRELCGILSGLVLAADYKVGQELFQDRDFATNAEFFQDIFELGRRHKIMNPEKMRGTYGKLVYMLQDSQIPEVKDMLQFSCVKPIKSVYSILEARNSLGVLQDDLIHAATMEIVSEGKSRYQIQSEIKQKERAIEILARKYGGDGNAGGNGGSEIIRQCLYSIGDNHAFLRTNRDPCDKMIEYLTRHFDPRKPEEGYSLAIMAGREGARLSHGHEKQYQYVLQSLTLWREVLHEMFMLWGMAETDLLEESNVYRLRDTGQGLNRVQAAPRVSRIMHTILHRAQQRVGSWVGSSVIHLGDHNVPNALMFIDKYTQIYRILLPITTTLSKITTLAQQDTQIRQYLISAFGSIDNVIKDILADFFRHAFDGSGADNFFDAGSCIDGRLTSAWNWCSMLEKKRYFPVFLLTGFNGFDGQF